MKKFFSVIVLLVLLTSGSLFSHCQIPCGIFGDEAVFGQLMEHFETIEKSMKLIVELSSKEKVDHHTLVRWVNNKEDHADKVHDILTNYFLCQRVKIVGDTSKEFKNYQKKVQLIHSLMVLNMQSRQKTDTSVVETMRTVLNQFKEMYFYKH